MDFISTGTEILKQENVLTPRQKDIIDTEKEMLKSPFDRNTAIAVWNPDGRRRDKTV